MTHWLLDKFLLMMALISAAAIIVVVSNPPSNAQILEVPDFNKYPPRRHMETRYDLGQSFDELQYAYFDAENGSDEEWAFCNKIVDLTLEYYLKDWPRFTQAAQDPGWRAAWATHFAKRDYRGTFGCYLVDPLKAVTYLAPKRGDELNKGYDVPRWCGQWRDGHARDEADRAFQQLIPLAFYWAVPDAVRWLSYSAISHNNWGYTFWAMNPDVHYYLMERSRIRQDPKKSVHHIPLNLGKSEMALMHTLTAQQKQSLTNAAIAGDYQSVLEGTAPCRSRKKMVLDAGMELDDMGWFKHYTTMSEPRAEGELQ